MDLFKNYVCKLGNSVTKWMSFLVWSQVEMGLKMTKNCYYKGYFYMLINDIKQW